MLKKIVLFTGIILGLLQWVTVYGQKHPTDSLKKVLSNNALSDSTRLYVLQALSEHLINYAQGDP